MDLAISCNIYLWKSVTVVPNIQFTCSAWHNADCKRLSWKVKKSVGKRFCRENKSVLSVITGTKESLCLLHSYSFQPSFQSISFSFQMNLRSVFTVEQQRILQRYYENGMTNQSKNCFQLILQCAQETKLDFSVVRVSTEAFQIC